MTFIFKSFFSCLLILFMTACSTIPETKVVTKTTYLVPEVPERFFQQSKPDRPPEKAVYMAMSPAEKETALVLYSQGLLRLLASCQGDVMSIQKILSDTKTAADHESRSSN